MMERDMHTRKVWIAFALALAAMTALASMFFFSIRVQTAAGASLPNPPVARAIPLNAVQDEGEMPAHAVDDAREEREMAADVLSMRWNGETWEYSVDGGKTWTQSAPNGVQADGRGGMTVWQGAENRKDLKIDALVQEIDRALESILDAVDERYGKAMPEGVEAESLFVFGEIIARQMDGVWEFSSDGGETWTKETPKGFEAGEDGLHFHSDGERDAARPGEGSAEDALSSAQWDADEALPIPFKGMRSEEV